MKSSLFSLAFLSCALLITSMIAGQAVEVNQAAPDFTATDHTGKSHQLKDFRGKFVVLEWVNYDCPFVVKHYSVGNMQKLQKDFTAQGVVWLSICSSAPGKQGHFPNDKISALMQERSATPTAYLIDEKGTVGKLYGAKTTPHMYIVDPKGVLVYAGAIDSIRSADSADVAKATNYVKAALDESLANKPVTTKTTQAYGCSVKY
jgi:peroxiredoxin